MHLVDKDKLIEVYDQIHIGPPDSTRKMIEAAPVVTDIDIIEDILKRGQMRFSREQWETGYGDEYKDGLAIMMRSGDDVMFLDFNSDGSVCTYEDFEI